MDTTERPIYAIGPVNWIGLWTLYKREVRRFLKVAAQTVVGPVITALLFLTIFYFALGRHASSSDRVSYLEFLASGLIVMTMTQNAFANTSSSILIAKVQGNIVDLLMAPLSAAELTCGFALGGATRGLLVGAVVATLMWPIVPFGIENMGYVVFHAVAASLLLAFLGILGGLWAQKMDQLAAVTNFIVMPMTFLSGTFYSVADLPPVLGAVAHANPFFYMIDGFRYGITGYGEGSLVVGILVLTCTNLVLAIACYRLIAMGWRLKS